MSEKRFIFATNEKRFNLDDESRIWDNGTPMTALDIVVMLNEQQATIEQLQEELELTAKNKLFSRRKLEEENEQLRQTMQKVCELLEEEVDLFSDKATEHDVIAYREMQDFDNKDAYYICTATKKAIQMLKR